MFTHFFGGLRHRLARLDYVQMLFAAALLAIGLLTIYGTGQQAGGQFADYWQRQLVWAGLGLVVFFVVSLTSYEWLGRHWWIFYVATLLLLLLLLPFGRTINGARSWLPLFGVTLQPAEFAKPATVLLLAWLASRPSLSLTRLHHVLPPLLAVAPLVVLIGLQPDWGTALVFLTVTGTILFLAGIPWRWILLLVLVAAITAPIAFNTVLTKKQRDRLITFVQPGNDISDTGWNAHQSLLAVGSGGLHGKGLMKGTQHVLGFLPRTVAPTDFIFSVIGEEMGFVGAAGVVLAYIGLIYRCLRASARAPDDFGGYLAGGVAAFLFTHAYINIGMTIHAAPIIGIPLPLVSYGGSFLLSTLVCLGLVQAVYRERR
ncbi:MAG: rod shape-determining protein RodA [Lentisphaeria bacterium]